MVQIKDGVITLDGPAGSGKSTMARKLAEALGMSFLDTGAMYRGVAAAMLDLKIDPSHEDLVNDHLGAVKISFDWDVEPPALMVNGKNYSQRIRENEVSQAASKVAAHSCVRRYLVESQQKIGRDYPKLVTEGRDQGSVVFPEAPVKFYLDASPEIRAQRRITELEAKGEKVDLQTMVLEIKERDHRDMNREDSPLVVPEGAITLDTSDMSPENVLKTLTEHVVSVLGSAETEHE